MKRTLLRAVGRVVCGCVILFGSAAGARAQAVRQPGLPLPAPEAGGAAGVESGRGAISIRKVTGVNRRDRMMTPQYTTSVSRGSKPPREWGMVTVEYASQPEWLDEVTVNFYVLSMVSKNGRNVYSLYRKDVTYVDVKQDRLHVADVYLMPSALERFGPVAAVAVDISVKGERVAQQSETAIRDTLPVDWWKSEKVVKSEAVTARDGYLLSRKESPFVFINIDDYEAIK